MSYTRFNGATCSLTDANATEVLSGAGISSFSYEGGDRSEIDITESTSVRREVVPGFMSPRRLSIGLLLDTTSLSELDDMLGECGSGTLAITFGQGCAAPSQFLSLPVFLMNYAIQGELDGVLEISCSFMVDERPDSDPAPDPDE